MKNIKLHGTEIETSAIGFGCAGLMRTVTSKGRQKLLNAAFDSGIKHYDVARMYGLGRAESEVGRFIKSRRDQVVIASKFGIDVSPRTQKLAPIINLARLTIRLFPSIRNVANNNQSALYQERHFDTKFAQASLEKSLTELGTDYIDCLFLHEPNMVHLNDCDVLEFLQKAKDKGMIREYGIAGYTEDCLGVIENIPELVRVLQVPNDVLGHQLDEFKDKYNGGVVTFSPFSSALNKIINLMNDSPDVKKIWADKIGCEQLTVSSVLVFLLQYCLESNSDGVVLCSSSKPERIVGMARVANDEIDKESVERFVTLVRSAC